jgi:hypothetical protein
MSRRVIALLVATACLLGGCGLPEPYETYPPSTPPPPPPRAANALTVAGATTTTPDNEVEFGEPQSVAAPLVPEPAAPAPTPGGQVAICYNRIWNSADAVRSAAALACGAKSTPQVVSRDFDLNACPVMTPSHAVFACGAAK